MHRHIADALYREILSGRYPPGARLPAETELAERYGVARGTVRQALAALRADGVIASRKGARRVVLGLPLTQSFSELLSFSAWARALGEDPRGRVVELTRREATAVDADRLGLPVGETVYYLVRVRLLSGTPVMIERTTFPGPIGELVATFELDRESIFEELGRRGIDLARARHQIEAIPATAEDARLLELRGRAPLLRERRTTSSTAGERLEWSDDRYRGDAVSFAVENAMAARSVGRLLSAFGEGRREA